MTTPLIRTNLGDLEPAVAKRLRWLDETDLVRRIWEHDHTVWREDPAEIANRLGWLEAVERSRVEAATLRSFANDARSAGLTRTLLLGMGGSSLAPEVIRGMFHGSLPPPFDLRLLDTTHPDAIARVEAEMPATGTLVVVSSKSGTTIETRSHLAYFHSRIRDGGAFVAITDPGTPLEEEAARRGFRRVFHAPPDVGGRYSALTVFGLLPAALTGVDPELLLVEAADAMQACLPEVPVERNPAAVLGAVMGEAALAGRDKLTLLLPEDAAPFGAWVEQLVAESTGKEGRGILPVDGEPPGRPDSYGDDRLFVGLGDVPELEPSAALSFSRAADVGGLFLVFELATAVAGAVLAIHPFDQPDVQEAKDRTEAALASGERPEERLVAASALLETVRPGDYVAILAFADPTPALRARLQEARARIRDRLRVATTLGYGPRYLHSTGQLHKGGPPSGVFLQLFEEPTEDREVPGRPYTFGRLCAAQAAGDLDALRARGRRVGRVALDDLLAWDG